MNTPSFQDPHLTDVTEVQVEKAPAGGYRATLRVGGAGGTQPRTLMHTV